MILPKGQALHENLNASFIDFEQLLNELRANQFTGYLSLTGWKYLGVIFIDSGNLDNVIEEADGKRRTGLVALETLRAKAKDRDGAISVFRLEGDLVALLASSAQRAALYEELTNDLTNFDRLMLKLEKEHHTGHIEVVLKDKDAGMIFFEKGATVAAFYSRNGSTVMGREAIVGLNDASISGAVFNVYRSDPASSSHDFVKLELIEAWQSLLSIAEKSVDAATAPGTFSSELKRGCLEIVMQYPFLDPFTGGFEFKNGHIHFEGGANNAKFTAGLALAFKYVSTKLNPRGVRALQDATQKVSQTQRTQLETWGITQALPSFF